MISEKDAIKIIEDNYNDVYKYCSALLRNKHDAEEVTQEVFIFFWEQLDGLSDEYIRSWLISVAKNKIHEAYRVRRIDIKRFATLDVHEYSDETPDDFDIFDEIEKIDDKEILNIKERIINSLTDEERELFIYIYEKKMKYNTIAQLLNINDSALGVRAYRLRTKIKKMAETAFIIAIFVAIKLKTI